MRKPMCDSIRDRLVRGVEKAKAAGASAARIHLHHGEVTGCRFENGRLKDTGSSETISYGVDVVVAGRRGTASGNRLESFEEMIDGALTFARSGSVAHFDAYPPPGDVTPVKTHSERMLGLTREKMIESCGQMVDAVKAYNPKLFIACSAGRREGGVINVTSGGVCHEQRGTAWSLSLSVQRTEGTDILFAGYGRGWRDLNEFYDPGLIADRVITDLRWAERPAKPPRGRVKAYFPPESVGMLVMPVVMGINGRNVAKGDSPLAGRLGERVLADSITVEDDPHRDFSGGAAEVDSSGIPTRKQTLFEGGVLRQFLYDLDSAGLAGAEPTGNDGCGPYCLVARPGARPSNELLADIDDGIYIKSLLGYGQGNIINGDFSCNVGLGYRIRNGEIVGRIKDTMVAGNVYDILGGNVELSSDLDHEGRTPHVVVEGINTASP